MNKMINFDLFLLDELVIINYCLLR